MLRQGSKTLLGAMTWLLLVSAATGDVHGQAARPALAFNELTHLIISDDGQSVRLFGRMNAAGPQGPVPYLQFLAAALLLPEERGDLGAHGSIPGFSLDVTPQSLQALSSLRRRMNSPEAEQLMGKYYANPAVWRSFLHASLPQIWEDVREILKRLLYQGLGRRQADVIINRINSVEDLRRTLDTLLRERWPFSSQEDVDHAIERGLHRFQTRVGSVFFFPEGTTETLYGTALYSEPKYLGMHRDTQLARVVFEADLAIKLLARSVDLKKRLPFHQPMMEWELRNSTPQEMSARLHGGINAIQVHPKKVELEVSANGRIISFTKAEMLIQVRPWDQSETPYAAQLSYSQFVTERYGQYAAALGALWEFREAAKMLAVARHLKAAGIRLYLSLERSWTAPKSVKANWLAGSLGGGGQNFYLVSHFYGGVGLQMRRAASVEPMPREASDRFKTAAEQLSGVLNTADSGICMDGRPGCRRGESLGTLRINLPPPGARSISKPTLERMMKDPATRALLDAEARADKAMVEATAAVQAKERALAVAPPAAKPQLQVELVRVRQTEANAKSAQRVAQIKVADAAKIIDEVELLPSTPNRK
ncbi:MAG: hypothetical protein KF889_10760 [Alphaproteobacteria bacterium]|nr:hypothetical protein [Alphaproteobacteria bacterium]MCW5741305.1 hypothetical protein [Alphaproteobacteria bacterium]